MIVFSNFKQGRLGNQLFFVASTIGIATKNNTSWGFSSQMGHGNVNYQTIFKNELPIVNTIPNLQYHQIGFSYYDVLIDNVELIGYFQSEKFFAHCHSLIREQFEFKQNVIDQVIEKYPQIYSSLSVHIRRGDYITQPNHHPVLPINYYNKILNEIEENYEYIFIFSDDINWAKKNFIGDKYIFPEYIENNDLFSFVLMSLSKDHIISNSTYSWWAAWLNKNNNKKVYCPNHNNWFGPAYEHLNTKDIFPENWIEINFL